VRTLRVREQAKQVAHTGPPISFVLSKEQPFGNAGPPSKKIIMGPQIERRYLKQIRL
jgi:hypothetical protein